MRKPRLMSFTPCAVSGWMRSPTTGGGAFTPIIIGTFGPYTSASMRPTRRPRFASATARFTDTVDFPTPPLPLEIAMMRPRCGYATGVGAGGTALALGSWPITGSARLFGGAGGGGGGVVDCEGSFTSTRTSCTPSTRSAACRTSRTSDAGSCASSRIVKRTRPSMETATSRIIPERMTSSRVRGLTTPASACAMRACIGSVMCGSASDSANGANLGNLLAQMRLDADCEHFGGQLTVGTVTGYAQHRDALMGLELDELDVHRFDA